MAYGAPCGGSERYARSAVLMHEGGGVGRRRPGKRGKREGEVAGFYVGCRTAGNAVRGCGGPRVCLHVAVTCPARKSVRVR
eukprot:2347476-Prymnesium_polylepis.1